MSMEVARIQNPAPQWIAKAVVNGEIKTLSSKDFAGKWLVMFSYPLDWTFNCPTEIREFNDRSEDFAAIGCNVVGWSVDSAFSHLNWTLQPRKEGGLGPTKIPLLGDITKQISATYGCLITTGDDAGVAARATYIIDPKGIVRHISVNDLNVSRNIDEVLRLVSAFQFSDEHGEVCPATWKKKGDKTIVPDVKASKAFFASS